MQLVILAARNLRRNPRRTLITAAAIAFGLAMMIWTVNIGYGQYQAAIRAGISSMAGHVVVQAAGYNAGRDEEQLLDGSAEVVSQLQEALPGATVTRRVWLGGLLNSATSSVGAGLEGVDPGGEAAVGTLDDKLIEGEWLDADGTQGIVLGATMAETLDVGVGDKVVYMGQHGTEEVSSHLFRVKGIFKTGMAELDGFVAVVPIAATWDLLERTDVAHQVSLHLPDARQSEAAHRVVEARVDGAGREILWWKEALPDLWTLIQLDAEMNNQMMAILGIVVAMGVLNTVLMSVMERTREFGVLMAIGMKPRKLAAMVLLEGLVLGALSTVVGVALGALFTWPTAHYGIDYSKFMGETMEFGGVGISTLLKADWDMHRIVLYSIAAVLFTGAAAAWPAWLVSRLTPMDALRRNG